MTTKNVDAALLRAREACSEIRRDAVDKRDGFKFVSAETMFKVGGGALTNAGLVLVPVCTKTARDRVESQWPDNLRPKLEPALMIIRSFVLRHAESGEQIELELPWPVLMHDKRIDRAFPAAITSSLKYLVRDLLMLPAVDGDEEGREDDEEPKPTGQGETVKRIEARAQELNSKGGTPTEVMGEDLEKLSDVEAGILGVNNTQAGGTTNAPVSESQGGASKEATTECVGTPEAVSKAGTSSSVTPAVTSTNQSPCVAGPMTAPVSPTFLELGTPSAQPLSGPPVPSDRTKGPAVEAVEGAPWRLDLSASSAGPELKAADGEPLGPRGVPRDPTPTLTRVKIPTETVNPGAPGEAGSPKGSHECDGCSRSFQNAKGLATHRRIHGKKPAAESPAPAVVTS